MFINPALPVTSFVVRLIYQWPIIASALGIGFVNSAGNTLIAARRFATNPIEDLVMTVRKLVFRAVPTPLRFRGRPASTSVVEFALLLPFDAHDVFRSIEVTDAISADRQVTLVAGTVADIAAQYQSVTATDVNNILQAASAVLAPFSVANAKVTLSSVQIDANGNATVDWSASLYGTQRTGTVTNAIPTALRVANTSVIWGEATYAYKPLVGRVVTGTLNLYEQIFMRPRLSQCVKYTGVSTLC